jgi:hypothetical protein
MTAAAASKAATSRGHDEPCKPRANYLNLKATGKPQQAAAQVFAQDLAQAVAYDFAGGVLTCGHP